MSPTTLLPEQPPEAPLNAKAQTELQNLTRLYQNDREMKERLKNAAEVITKLTGDINDRAHELQKRHDKKLGRLAGSGQEEAEGEKKEFEDFQTRVEELTKTMDHSMRKTVDHRIWFEELPNSVRHVSDRASAATQQPQAEDDDTEQATVAPDNTPSALLEAAFSTHDTRWNDKSLTDRYAHDADYGPFYQTLWDAQHTENSDGAAAPLPAPALWFAREENPSTTLSQPQRSQSNLHTTDDDDDLAIAAERVSLKCPITLRYYSDPVTSTICKHSFDRTPILDMLKTSDAYVPFTPTQQAELSQLSRGQRAAQENRMCIKRVRCPDAGCNQFITEDCLRSNPMLLRRVTRKIEEERRRAAESSDVDDEDEDELHGPRGTQRKPFGVDGIDSSPPPAAKRARVKGERLKSERRSRVPQTQLSAPSGTQRTTAEGATVVDLDDTDDDE